MTQKWPFFKNVKKCQKWHFLTTFWPRYHHGKGVPKRGHFWPQKWPLFGTPISRFRAEKRGKMAKKGSFWRSKKWPKRDPHFGPFTVALTMFDGRARVRAPRDHGKDPKTSFLALLRKGGFLTPILDPLWNHPISDNYGKKGYLRAKKGHFGGPKVTQKVPQNGSILETPSRGVPGNSFWLPGREKTPFLTLFPTAQKCQKWHFWWFSWFLVIIFWNPKIFLGDFQEKWYLGYPQNHHPSK